MIGFAHHFSCEESDVTTRKVGSDIVSEIRGLFEDVVCPDACSVNGAYNFEASRALEEFDIVNFYFGLIRKRGKNYTSTKKGKNNAQTQAAFCIPCI
jgi:hypothetical protein